jgi:transglutaminase-like putative cysteine protease
MKKFVLALALLALFSTSLFSQSKKVPAVNKATVRALPAPIRKNPSEADREKPTTLGITVEKYVKNFEVNRDATAVETWEMQQRFDSDLVVERFKKFERSFNGDLQKAEVLDAYIVKADGTRVALAPDAVQIKPTPQAEAAPSFSSYKQIRIAYDDLEKGDATYFKIRLTTLKPNFEKQFDFLEVFPLGYAWKSIEVNLTAPADFPLNVQAVDLNGGRLADENGKAHWRWRRENLKAFDIEPGMYDFFNSSPRVAATSFKNFDELGAAYWSEAVKKAVVTAEVQALADEITKDINEPEQQAYAIYEWVNKNIRYLSVVLEKGGWIPHSTTEILANRYGDCKDYSTILYALLKAKNIESYPVLIRSEMGDWFPEVAAPDYFNHAILYIPSLKLFADATAPNTRLGLITQQIVGKRAILAGEKTGVVETPKNNPSNNQLLSDVEINFAPDGSLKAVSKNTYDGRTEIIFRPLFADSEFQRNSGNFVKTLLSYFGVEGSGKLLKIGNPYKVGEPLTVEMEVEMPDFTTFMPKGALRLPIAVNMLNSRELEQYVKPEQRKTNLILGATRFKETFKLNFPDGVKILNLPPAINFSNSVGSYRSEFTFEDGGVRVLRELVISRDIISTKDYPQIRELIKKSVEGSNAEIRYSANPLFAFQKELELRKNPAAQTKSKSSSSPILNEKSLTDAQAAQVEAGLMKSPDDAESRKRLLRFYSNYEVQDTISRQNSRLKHRLWFLQNHPEIDDSEIYGYKTPFYSSEEKEYQALRDEWLKQVEADKTNSHVRLNAVEFTRDKEPEVAQKLLVEGARFDKENYEFPLLLSDLVYTKLEELEDENPSEYQKKKSALFKQAFENGETALALLKKERSTDRDQKRVKLLQSLTKIAFELGKFDRAKAMATELILDFGQDAASASYDDATHIGNIILGRIALRENDEAKAEEYLLIAIRAPLRAEKSYFSGVDMQLAKELLEKGAKSTVAEYLKLCEKLLNNSELYTAKVQTLKTWQEQINQGKTPSFDFRKF